MKHQIVRKRLLMETMMIMGGLCVGGVTAYYLDVLHGEYEQQNIALQTQVATLNNEMTSLNDKYLKINKNHAIYEEAKEKQAKEGLAVNSELIRRLFAGYNTRYYLKNLSLQMSPVQEITDAPYKRSTSALIFSEINVSVDALTDQDIYKLIQSIQKDLSGVVRMSKITVTRQNRLTGNIAKDIVEKGEIKMVSASLKFMWLGIRPIEATQQAVKAPNGPVR